MMSPHLHSNYVYFGLLHLTEVVMSFFFFSVSEIVEQNNLNFDSLSNRFKGLAVFSLCVCPL